MHRSTIHERCRHIFTSFPRFCACPSPKSLPLDDRARTNGRHMQSKSWIFMDGMLRETGGRRSKVVMAKIYSRWRGMCFPLFLRYIAVCLSERLMRVQDAAITCVKRECNRLTLGNVDTIAAVMLLIIYVDIETGGV